MAETKIKNQALNTLVTDSGGATGYLKIGNTLIQWGVTADKTTSNGPYNGFYYSSDTAVTFPVAFKTGTVPVITLGLAGGAGGAFCNSYGLSATGVNLRLLGWANAETSKISWLAIGIYQ